MSNQDGQTSLLGHVFDEYQNMRQIERCIRLVAGQGGIDRPRVLEASRRPTRLPEYLPGIELTRYPTHDEDENTIQPVRLPFGDHAFDATIVTDAYEHMTQSDRVLLLDEMIRTTKGVVLLGCPMRSDIVRTADRVVFDFIWGKYAEVFHPLEQHEEFGIDSVAEVTARLRVAGADRVVALPCNFVYRWIHQILIYFDQQHENPHRNLFESVNRIYNENLSAYDYREPCYRYLLVVATDPAIDLDRLESALREQPHLAPGVKEVEGTLIDEFRAIDSRAADQLRWYSAEHARLTARVHELEANGGPSLARRVWRKLKR